MGAVVEPASPGQVLDLREDLADAGLRVPEADPAQSGCVDQYAPGGQNQQIAGRGGVPALAVDVTGGLYFHDVVAEQRVGKGRLARTGRPEQHTRAARDDGAEDVEPLPGGGADGQHLNTGRDGFDVLDEIRQRVGVRHQIGLGQHHDRLGCTVRGGRTVPQQSVTAGAGHGEREEALHPPQVELHGERDADGDVVDVGGEHLPFGALRRRRAHEGGAPRQQRPYELRITVGVDGDPVARADDPHRVAGDDECGVRADGAVRGDDIALTTVHPHHPSGQQPRCGVRCELGRPGVVPAVRRQRMRRGRAGVGGERGKRGKRGERQGKPFGGWPRQRALGRGEVRKKVSRRPRGENDALPVVGSAHRNDGHQCPHLLVHSTGRHRRFVRRPQRCTR